MDFEFRGCRGLGSELSTLWFVVQSMSCNFVNEELR